MTELLFYSLLGGLFSLVGGMLLLWKPAFTQKASLSLIAFGAGAFLSATFQDILPEAIEMSAEPHPILGAALMGFLAFFIAERFIMKYAHSPAKAHRHHDDEEHTESLPYLLVVGDVFHNFIDGIVIALAFVAEPALALSTALAIAAHEIPQEIGDFSVLLHLGWKKSKVLAVNILQSLATIPGVFIGYFVGSKLEAQLPLLLGATAGIFLYITASDLIPILHHKSGHKHVYRVVLPMIFGVMLVAWLARLAHGE